MDKKQCKLCLSTEDDELNYGQWLTHENLTVHHYCLLFAPALPQNGLDEEGYEGFLIPDIKREIKRVSRINCKFCLKKGANLGCSRKSCRSAYHTNCGLKNNVIFEFTSKFLSFCTKHKQIVQKEDRKKVDKTCRICYARLEKTYPNSILIPCCKNSWFHKKCLQKFALTAGSAHFKCPLCGSKCSEELKLMGIFFPERDALWELEENAFEEMYRPIDLICESKDCPDPKMNADKQYEFKLCDFCGSAGIHYNCYVGPYNGRYTCRECQLVFSDSKNETSFSLNRSKRKTVHKDCSNIQTPPKKSKSFAAEILGESDASTSDDENIPIKIGTSSTNIQQNKLKKPKSFAAEILGESDCTSSDEENPTKYTYIKLS